jgi:hypothetical protein
MEEEGMTQEEAFNQAIEADYTHEWDWLAAELGQWIEWLNPDEQDWVVEFSNAGWQNRSGTAIVEWSPRTQQPYNSDGYYRELGNAFIGAILPQTDNIFTIFYNGSELRVSNAHHDSPMGETYIVMTGIPCEFCESVHGTEEEARSCCFPCEVCEDLHQTQEGAENCCFVCPHCESVTEWGTTQPTVYRTKEEMENCCHLCPICESNYDTPEEAQNCCN